MQTDTNNKTRRLTLKELKQFNGKNGKPAYVVFKGKIYDISGSPLWLDGDHRGHHVAGGDLTPEMTNAPHNGDVLGKFPVIGELTEGSFSSKLQKRFERLHFHSMIVHFSIALGLIMPLSALAYLVTSDLVFERASRYLLTLLLAVTPLSGLSGLFSWKVTYEGRRGPVFDRKIILSIAETVLVIACFVWQLLVPDLLEQRDYHTFFYLILLFGMAGITSLLGHYGGKIIFP